VKKTYARALAVCLAIALLCAISINCTHDTIRYELTTSPVAQMTPSSYIAGWSDNFDDDNVSDWQFIGANMTTDPGVVVPANYSLSSNSLWFQGPNWNFVIHNSSVAYGTWTFSVFLQRPINNEAFYVAFVGTQYTEDWLKHSFADNGYLIRFLFTEGSDAGNYALLRSTTEGGWVGQASAEEGAMAGWKDFIITRDPTGQFYVYLNGDPIMGVKDTTTTVSETFSIFSGGNPGIADISVINYVTYDNAPPEWVEPLEDQEITAGQDFEYDVNATDYAGIDHYWVDDMENFAIDNDGVITNAVNLAAGTYPIKVSVNDTYGNTRSETFDLVVTPGGIPMEYLVVGGGVVVVVILVLVIWWMRKR
jgi:hypothetical protein